MALILFQSPSDPWFCSQPFSVTRLSDFVFFSQALFLCFSVLPKAYKKQCMCKNTMTKPLHSSVVWKIQFTRQSRRLGARYTSRGCGAALYPWPHWTLRKRKRPDRIIEGDQEKTKEGDRGRGRWRKRKGERGDGDGLSDKIVRQSNKQTDG